MSMSAQASDQLSYFNHVRYRDPSHPAVAAYADPKLEFVARHVPLCGQILDVGCGNGIFTWRLALGGASVVGIDFSRPLLAQNPHNARVCGDATTLPFADNSFDVVFEANVLHHVDGRERLIREMRRVSRRHVVLLEPNRYNPIMFLFSLAVPAEHGGLQSCLARLASEIGRCGMRMTAHLTTGMISQNNTPAALIPALRKFDRQIWWGEYIVAVAEK
jgi:SAM-dependent methyltransferase